MTQPVSERDGAIRRISMVVWSLLGTIVLLWVAGWVIQRVWIVVPPIVLAIGVIYVLNPVVSKLQQRGVARWLGSCLSYLVLLGILTAIGFVVIPSLADQGRDLAADFPQIYDDLVTDIEDLAGKVGLNDVEIPRYEEFRTEINESSNDFFSSQLDRITDITLSVLEALFLVVLAPVVAFYVLLDLPSLRQKTVDLIPVHHRDEAAHVGRQLGTALGGFLRGQLLVAVIVGVMSSVGFWLIDLPFWLLIGLIAGFLNIIPFVGPWVGGILGVAVALATSDLQTAVWAGLVALIVQQIDNHFVSPTVLRATVRIHPALIILGLLAGATIGGFWGVLLAVPLMASVKIIVGHFWRTRVLGQSWDEASEAIMEEHRSGETLITRFRQRRETEADGLTDDS